MGLTNAYILPTNRIGDILAKIRDGQAPERFTQQLLKDWGFNSTNDRGFIALLKAIGFLTADGKPTARYHDYRDHSRSKAVLGQALRDAYGDLFLIKEHPSESDKAAIEGKFKSFHNASDNVAGLMTKTFLGLLKYADLRNKPTSAISIEPPPPETKTEGAAPPPAPAQTSLHYNIQVHLPATKDVEVFNAIFKSLKEHLL